MLAGSCEKMVLISSTSNEWPLQKNQIIDGRSLMGSSGARVMEKPMDGQDQPPPPLPPPPPTQQPLKCPRCDSSNTKFCYYNNYSLSQPRHFCKACKRYWTRGGTLRNVPVGGGCRKNKRIKRPSAPSISSSSSLSSQPSSSPTPPNLQPQIDSSAQNHINPLLYGLPTAHTTPSFPRMFNSRVSNFESTISGFNNMGLGFSSYENGFPNTSSSSLLSSYNPVFGSSSSSSSSTTLASLIASSLHQGGNNNGFHGISSSPYGEMQVAGNLGGGEMGKEVKMEGENSQNRLNNHWNNGGVSSHYQIINQNSGQINTSSDHNNNNNNPSLSWNNGGSWFDPSNMGSSVPSLI